MENIILKLQEFIAFYGLKIIGAIVIFIVGRWIAKIVKNIIYKIMTKRDLEGTLISFACNITYVALIVFVVIAALGQIGIKTTSFIAVIGAAGLAVALALQGSMSNFAAGFLIIIFKPFIKGDFIEGAGASGVVEEVQVFTTILITPDNKKIIIPNNKLLGDNIVNFSALGTRRAELVIGVSYSDDIDKVRSVLQEIADSDSRILKEPGTMILVKELADSSVNFILRVWVGKDDYWGVYFDTMENVKKRFDAENICIPFPQRDVHMFENK